MTEELLKTLKFHVITVKCDDISFEALFCNQYEPIKQDMLPSGMHLYYIEGGEDASVDVVTIPEGVAQDYLGWIVVKQALPQVSNDENLEIVDWRFSDETITLDEFAQPAFIRTTTQYHSIAEKLREQCCDYLRSVIKEHDAISFDGYDIPPMVAYDGGNHPEYESTLYSCVKAIYVNCNYELCFDLEDDGMYTADRILLCDLISVTEMVYDNYETLFNVNNNESE